MSNFLGWTSLLDTIIWQFIDFPNHICKNKPILWRFEDLPGVYGAVDGTHVHIIAPTVNEETYQ